jgi:dUTP pyrophosphatase
MTLPVLKWMKINPNAKIPVRALPGDLGFDIFALETVVVQPSETITAETGVSCQFPSGWGGILKARSSQGKAGIHILGGVVDSGYRGEIKVLLYNGNRGDNPVIYKAGEKIAQLVLVQTFPGTSEETNTIDSTERGDRGFGSTGK